LPPRFPFVVSLLGVLEVGLYWPNACRRFFLALRVFRKAATTKATAAAVTLTLLHNNQNAFLGTPHLPVGYVKMGKMRKCLRTG